jgi:hypothetical protein
VDRTAAARRLWVAVARQPGVTRTLGGIVQIADALGRGGS